MAEKQNTSPSEIDMTSFSFVLMCGVCHPGGGPLEFDRRGNRYDVFMEKKGLVPGGENGLDGDYYKALWSKTGVVEADCLICHMPGYRFEARNKELKALNFRFAATVGAGFGEVQGEIKKGASPRVVYDLKRFDENGHVKIKIVKEVPSENCLNCHRESDFKKRGASYDAGGVGHPVRMTRLRCVDCHWAGSSAGAKKIQGQELHEIGKGDDPGGHVRDDLDNTVRTCRDCHQSGKFGAPKMFHKEFPPRHLEKIACVTCHIPFRRAKAALIQDATVFNLSPGIWPPPKRIWSFYGPDGRPWNYYGEVHKEGARFQRNAWYVPERGWYKGKIWPLNRVHSQWVGIVTPGKNGLGMVFMKDFFTMWKLHEKDPERNFPGLSTIKDDNRDGFLEVNTPHEIRALLHETANFLISRRPLKKGAYLVLVKDDEYTRDGHTWTKLEKMPFEASPYASVFKYSHDILPASSALGSGGCQDCHSLDSEFLFRPVLVSLWDKDGRLGFVPNYKTLGYSYAFVLSGAIRQQYLSPIFYWSLLVFLSFLGIYISIVGLPSFGSLGTDGRIAVIILTVALFGPAITVLGGKFLSVEALRGLGVFHKLLGPISLVALTFSLKGRGKWNLIALSGAFILVFQAITGLMLILLNEPNTRQILFTIHDTGAMLALLVVGLFIVKEVGKTK